MLRTVYVVACSNIKLITVCFAASNTQRSQEDHRAHTYCRAHLVHININGRKIKPEHNIE